MGNKKSLPQPKVEEVKNQEEKFQFKIGMDDTSEELKKVIIVVGKMGHGKSSFINTLILHKDIRTDSQITSQMQKKLMKAQCNVKSITTECVLVQVHESHNILEGQKLYVIDTPGLDSLDAICLVSEQIDNIIVQKKCQIIGIAYVINLADREVSTTNHSTIKQFLKVLKIKKQLKNSLIFFILSSWDMIVQKKEKQIQNILTGFERLITEIGVPDPETKLIKWVNTICPNEISLKSFLEQMGGQKIRSEQWRTLQKIIYLSKQTSIKSQNHLESMKNFWQTTSKEIFSSIKQNNILYKNHPTKIDFTQLLEIKVSEQIQNTTKIFIGSQLLHGSGLMAFGIVMLPLGGLGAVPFASGLVITGGTVTFMIKKISQTRQRMQDNKNESKQDHIRRIIKQKFNQCITQKLKYQIISKIIQDIKISNDKIIINPFMNIQRIKKFDIHYDYKKRRIRICQILGEELQVKQEVKLQLIQKILSSDQLKKFNSQQFRSGPTPAQRIPQIAQVYVQNEKNKLQLQFVLQCYLPKEQCYYDIINQQCVKMFGQYK